MKGNDFRPEKKKKASGGAPDLFGE